jgi:signal transduction histidine kinase
MKQPGSENVRWYVLVGGLVALLALLAVLQYRSVKSVSLTMREQMRANLGGSLMDVREALDRELRPLCRELQRSSSAQGNGDLQEVAVGLENWRSGAAHPALVKAVYVWQPSASSQAEVATLNASATALEKVNWPEDLVTLRARLSEMGDNPGRPYERRDPGRRSGDHRPEGPMRPFLWMIDQDVPALVHPFYMRRTQDPGEQKDLPIRWLIVVLDRTVLGQHIFPEEIQRYFGAGDQSSYEIAVIDRNGRAPDLYVSDPRLNSQGFRTPDGALNLFGRPAPGLASGEPPSAGMFIPPFPNSEHRANHPGGPARFQNANPDEAPPALMVQPIHYALGQEWEIVAKHRLGSVDAAVDALSRRNLLFNLGILAVLAATMAMIIGASLRARRFGQLQMDFVANVSHELRTPLTGIVSAAQNMADGLIDDKQKVATYGKAIAQQARQLSELVEQTLQFSAIQKNGDRYHFQPVNVADALTLALQNISALIQAAGTKVEQEIEPGLPPVSADFKALSGILQNLIGNAVKYGGDQRWIGIRAFRENRSEIQPGISISIADQGMGISPADLHHIFEPFYRTREVTEAQIHGSGLGLPLAKKMAEAMGGSITVRSEVGKGSTFTLHLPLQMR